MRSHKITTCPEPLPLEKIIVQIVRMPFPLDIVEEEPTTKTLSSSSSGVCLLRICRANTGMKMMIKTISKLLQTRTTMRNTTMNMTRRRAAKRSSSINGLHSKEFTVRKIVSLHTMSR
jgi:hypothetical protein